MNGDSDPPGVVTASPGCMRGLPNAATPRTCAHEQHVVHGTQLTLQLLPLALEPVARSCGCCDALSQRHDRLVLLLAADRPLHRRGLQHLLHHHRMLLLLLLRRRRARA